MYGRYWYILKARETGYSTMYESTWGGAKRVIQARPWTSQGFRIHFQPPSPNLTPFWVFFRVSAWNPLNRWELGQTKARNGCSTLKIRQYHVASPWDPFVDLKASLPRPAVGSCLQRAPAKFLPLGSTPEPTAGPGKGAFGSTKMGPVG